MANLELPSTSAQLDNVDDHLSLNKIIPDNSTIKLAEGVSIPSPQTDGGGGLLSAINMADATKPETDNVATIGKLLICDLDVAVIQLWRFSCTVNTGYNDEWKPC